MLTDFYQKLEEDLASAGASCHGCGECCHFEQIDHVLYASEAERLHLKSHAPPATTPDGTPEQIAKGLRCPYQSGGHCQAREGRALGCRLHFCEWPDKAKEEELAERWHRKLKELHDRNGLPWDYRPLLPLDRTNQ